MIRTIKRESMVLLMGLAIQGAIAVAFSNVVKDLDLLHGIVAPIFVCVFRVAFFRAPAPAGSPRRWAVQQLLMAASLIVLMLFEMGTGLFMGAKGIPVGVWAVVLGCGLLYLALACVAEALNVTDRTDDFESA
jgi:hypothetical protein